MTRRVNVEIEGTSSLLMHKLNVEDLMQKTKAPVIMTDPAEAAERAAYRMPSTELCIEARHIKAAMLGASTWYKIGRKGVGQFIAGCVRIEPIQIGIGTKDYEIDVRPVTIKNGTQKNRIPRARPRIDKWKADFDLIYDENIFTDATLLKTILEEAGIRMGLLDFRPQTRGDCGTFKIVKWKEVAEE